MMTGWELVAFAFWLALACAVGFVTVVVVGVLFVVVAVFAVAGAVQVWEWLTS